MKFGLKLTAQQVNHTRKIIEGGETVSKVAKRLSVNRATVYRALQRAV